VAAVAAVAVQLAQVQKEEMVGLAVQVAVADTIMVLELVDWGHQDKVIMVVQDINLALKAVAVAVVLVQ
jgi:hypothetical protein